MAKVLVVEDNTANQRLMKMILESMGHGVVCAFTGEEGWVRVQEGNFALVILDMNLPGLDGFELCSRIKSVIGSTVKVMAVTALAMEGDRQKVLASGCDDYFSKPFSIPELRARVQTLLEEG